jgi:hypothetical protein
VTGALIVKAPKSGIFGFCLMVVAVLLAIYADKNGKQLLAYIRQPYVIEREDKYEETT